MAKVTPIQESFAAGEISPKLLGRRSIDGYRSGVATMENMIADPRGPAIGRNGFRYASQLAGADMRIGLLTVGPTSNLVFALTDNLLTITGILGPLYGANFVVNGDFTDGSTGWTVNSASGGSVRFDAGEAEINSGNNGNARISQQLALAGTGTHHVIVDTDGATVYRIKIGTADNDNTYYETVTSSPRVLADVSLPVTNPWITVERVSTDGVAKTITVNAVVLTDNVAQLDFATVWSEAELRGIYTVAAPTGDAIYMLHRNFQPYKLSITLGVVSFGPAVFTGQPASWSGSNWPASGAVFEGRLWMGGTPQAPQTFWGSKSGLLEDFTTGANANDGMEFSLSQVGAIVWMMGTKNLLIGTVAGEHVVTSEAGTITPTDIKIDQQSAYGSSKVQPIQVGDQIFYVSLDGTKVRALQYEWSADNWLSKDLTFFSQHITESGIREMSWAPNPNNLLLCTLNDGTMAWLSYERGENVWGWHKHITEGVVKDTASGVLGGFSFTTAAIIRDDGFINVETVTQTNTAFTDSWAEKEDILNPFTVVDGLDHLEGRTVQIVADDAVAPDQVVSGGQITLVTPANKAIVGLQYTPKLVTLPLESGSPTGSSLAYLKRYNRLIIGLLNSAGPLINGVRPPDRTPSTPMNTVEPNKTGQVDAYQLGWSEGVEVTIEQDLPLALQIIFIGGELPQDVL